MPIWESNEEIETALIGATVTSVEFISSDFDSPYIVVNFDNGYRVYADDPAVYGGA